MIGIKGVGRRSLRFLGSKGKYRKKGVKMGYRELIVWKKSKTLAVNIYKFTDYLPSKAKFSLAEQMNREAISIPNSLMP